MLTRTLAILVPEPGLAGDLPDHRDARAGDVLTVDPIAPLDAGKPLLLLDELGGLAVVDARDLGVLAEAPDVAWTIVGVVTGIASRHGLGDDLSPQAFVAGPPARFPGALDHPLLQDMTAVLPVPVLTVWESLHTDN
jgi:hypothetical protein